MTTVYEGDESSVVSSSRFANNTVTRPLVLFVDLTRTLLSVDSARKFKFGLCMAIWQPGNTVTKETPRPWYDIMILLQYLQ